MNRQSGSWGSLVQNEVLSQEERRKQQNREAQRNYRRRVKQRLDTLKHYETGFAASPGSVYTCSGQPTPAPSSPEWDPALAVQVSGSLTSSSSRQVTSPIPSTPLPIFPTTPSCQPSSAGLISASTALHQAISRGHSRSASVLIRNGANLEAMTSAGQTALHVAALMGQTDCVDMLVDFGCSLNHQDCLKQTALHLAVQHTHLPIVERLVSEGAALEVTDIEGMTPLHHAAASGNEEILACLLNAGANVHSRSGPRMAHGHQTGSMHDGSDPGVPVENAEWMGWINFMPHSQ